MNPLVVVLQSCEDLNIQLIVTETLAQIGYETALPYLKEVMERSGSAEELKAAAAAAFGKIDQHGLYGELSAAGVV